MNGNRTFLDTNVIVYLYSEKDLVKKQKAIDVINDYNCIVSTQVLNEFCNVGLKKLQLPIIEIRNILEEILDTCYLFVVNYEIIEQALTVKKSYGFSYYYSLMVASALKCDCDYLFSEDLQDGQVIVNTTIKNIF